MSATDVHDSPYAWTRLAISLAIATVGNVGMWSIVVVLPAVEAEFAVGRADAALPYTLTMAGFALGNLVIGRAVDRLGITRALIGAALVIAAGFGLSTLSGSVLALSLMQFVVGLGTGASFGPLIADISLWFQRRRGIAVAIAASGNYLSGAIWPTILAPVLLEHGWRGVHLSLAAATLLIMIPLALCLRRRVPAEAALRAEAVAESRRLATGFSPRALQWMLAAAGVGCCVAMAMPQVHIVALCTDLGYGPAVGAEMLSLMLMGGVASRIVFGLLADRLGGVRTLLIGSVLQMIALFLYLPFDGMASLGDITRGVPITLPSASIASITSQELLPPLPRSK